MREKVGQLRNVWKKHAKCGVIDSSLSKLNIVGCTTFSLVPETGGYLLKFLKTLY